MLPNFKKLKDMFSKEKFSVGLNIGVSSVKVVKLKFNKDITELCSFCLEQNRLDLEAVLKNIIQTQGIKRVNISVSGQQAISRYVDFPRMKASELKQALKFEAQKYIPFPIAEVNLDGVILREDLADNKMRILVAAVKKEFLNQRLKLLKSLGLEVDIVDIDSLALINAFNYNYSQDDNLKNKTIALLNIGSATSNLNILENGHPSLSRDISIGGNNFTQRLADAFGIDFKSAEEMKMANDLQKTDKVIAAIESILAKLAQEVRTSFDYYESRSVSSVEKIFISGGASLYPGLNEMLSGLLGLGVENWDPLRKIAIANNVDAVKLKNLSGQLAVAIGLALRS
jgi:type IV pilus assembly protein PilM